MHVRRHGPRRIPSASGETRTHSPMLPKHVRCQLRYTCICQLEAGFEPATHCLQSNRSTVELFQHMPVFPGCQRVRICTSHEIPIAGTTVYTAPTITVISRAYGDLDFLTVFYYRINWWAVPIIFLRSIHHLFCRPYCRFCTARTNLYTKH